MKTIQLTPKAEEKIHIGLFAVLYPRDSHPDPEKEEACTCVFLCCRKKLLEKYAVVFMVYKSAVTVGWINQLTGSNTT